MSILGMADSSFFWHPGYFIHYLSIRNFGRSFYGCGGRRAKDGGRHFLGSVFSSSKTSEFVSSVLDPAAFEGLGTAPPLGLHWGVTFKLLKLWLFFVFSAHWTAVLRCRRLTNLCCRLFRLRLQFFWHGFHGFHGFLLHSMEGLGTAPPLGLHWGVIFKFLKRCFFSDLVRTGQPF